MWISPGITNAKVLPDPVSAIAIKSWPDNTIGKTFIFFKIYTLRLYWCWIHKFLIHNSLMYFLWELIVSPIDIRVGNNFMTGSYINRVIFSELLNSFFSVVIFLIRAEYLLNRLLFIRLLVIFIILGPEYKILKTYPNYFYFIRLHIECHRPRISINYHYYSGSCYPCFNHHIFSNPSCDFNENFIKIIIVA